MVKQDELRYYQRGAIVAGVNVDPVTWRPDEHDDRARPALVGGRARHRRAALRPAVDRHRRRHAALGMRRLPVPRGGLPDAVGDRGAVREAALPEDSSLADWPISYADLEPYYERVEMRAGHLGRGRQHRRRAPGRRQPVRPAARAATTRCRRSPRGRATSPFVEATERLGLHPFRQPLAHQLRRVPGPSGLRELRVLPWLPVPCEGEVDDAGDLGARPRRPPATSSCGRTAACCAINRSPDGRA